MITANTGQQRPKFRDLIVFFVVLLAIALFSAGLSYADDILTCEGGCIDTHNLEIKTITIGKGKKAIKIYPKTKVERDRCEETAAEAMHPGICKKGGVITCGEDVEYPQFAYLRHRYGNEPDDNLELVNEQIKIIARKHKCSADFDYVSFGADRIYARNNLLSIVFGYVDYPLGAGGSCHGGYKALTYNTLKSAAPLVLSDIIEKKDASTLEPVLLSQLQNRLREMRKDRVGMDSESVKKEDATLIEAVHKYLGGEAWEGGFFIENGMVQINIQQFLFSCAAGNFFPVAVPDTFLKPDFLETLKKAREKG